MSDNEEDDFIVKKKMRKIAIDSDEDDNIPSSFLSIKPTKIEKEPISRKEYPHIQKKNVESDDRKPEKSQPQTPIHDKNHPQVKSEKKEKQDKNNEKPKNEKNDKSDKLEKKEKNEKIEKKEKDVKIEKKDNKEKNDKPKVIAKETKPTPKKSPQPKKVVKKEEVDSDASLFDPASSESEKKKEQKSHSKTGKKPQKSSNSNDQKSSSRKKTTSTNEKTDNSILKPKDSLINGILRRWWYCMEDWPPVYYDYQSKLLERKLRVVEFKNWALEPELNDRGLKKVYALEGFPGVYRDKAGLIDLRPKENCPSFDALKEKSKEELLKLYCTALTNQIKDLEESKEYEDTELLKELKKESMKAQKMLKI